MFFFFPERKKSFRLFRARSSLAHHHFHKVLVRGELLLPDGGFAFGVKCFQHFTMALVTLVKVLALSEKRRFGVRVRRISATTLGALSATLRIVAVAGHTSEVSKVKAG